MSPVTVTHGQAIAKTNVQDAYTMLNNCLI
jgi:hypothetical protein